MHPPKIKSQQANDADTGQQTARERLEHLLAEVRLEPGDPVESLLRALVEIVGVAYSGPEAAARKVDRAFEKQLVALREKLADEFAAGADNMRRNNLEAGRQITAASKHLSEVAEFLERYAGQLKTAKGDLAKAADTITAAAVAGLERRLLGALGGFEQAVATSGRQVADEYREMRKISERQIRGVRFWSRFSYGTVFASAALLWLAVCLASYVWLERRVGREYQSRLAEVEANYAANQAELKKLAEAKVKIIVDERRDQKGRAVPGQHIIGVENPVEYYRSTGGYGVIVFKEGK
jgi:hypothetical protein